MRFDKIDPSLLVHEVDMRIPELSLPDLNGLIESIVREFSIRNEKMIAHHETIELYRWFAQMLATNLPAIVLADIIHKRDMTEAVVKVNYESVPLLATIKGISETLAKSRQSGGMRDTIEISFGPHHNIEDYRIYNRGLNALPQSSIQGALQNAARHQDNTKADQTATETLP